MFLYQMLQLLLGVIFKGDDFNKPGAFDTLEGFEPIDLDMMKWWLIIGIVSGIYLFATGQLPNWMTNWINKGKSKEE